MNHKLKRCSLEHDTFVDDDEGQFYWADEVDKFLEELHKKIELLEGGINMQEETKEITFEGKTYTVPTWVKWVARDEDGSAFVYKCKPYMSESGWYGYDDHGDSCLRIVEEDTSWEDSLTEVEPEV